MANCCDSWACVCVERPNAETTEKEAGGRDVESDTPWCRQDRGLNFYQIRHRHLTVAVSYPCLYTENVCVKPKVGKLY